MEKDKNIVPYYKNLKYYVFFGREPFMLKFSLTAVRKKTTIKYVSAYIESENSSEYQ